MLRGLMLRLAIIGGVGAAVIVAYLALDYVQGAGTRQAQSAALSKYGAPVMGLCSNATGKIKNNRPPGTDRLVIINATDSTLFDPYNGALPTDRQAKDASEVSAVLCLSEKQSVFGRDKYGSPTDSTRYTCTQYARDLNAYLIDAKTGAVLASTTFDGDTPPDCPPSTGTDLTKTGALPPVGDVIDWLGSAGSKSSV